MGHTFKQMGWQDREVRVNRSELHEILCKNREQHVKDYNEACAGYRAQALARIDEIVNDLKAKVNGLKEGQTISIVGLMFGLNAPMSYEKAYDQIIKMMEMSVDKEIVLSSGQFSCFVMDDWDWKEDFNNTKMAYSASIGSVRR